MIKNTKTFISLVAIAITYLSSVSVAQEQGSIGVVEMPAVNNSAAFKEVKKRLGRWEGMMRQSISDRDIPVSYELKLTSGGIRLSRLWWKTALKCCLPTPTRVESWWLPITAL